jgi:hypothetical protein
MFERERHPVDIEHRGKSYRFYARELGYLHLQEILGKRMDDGGHNRRIADMICACIENEDGSLVFPTIDVLRDAPKSIYEACVAAMLKAQDLEPKGDSAQGDEVPEGNDSASPTSGMNSH